MPPCVFFPKEAQEIGQYGSFFNPASPPQKVCPDLLLLDQADREAVQSEFRRITTVFPGELAYLWRGGSSVDTVTHLTPYDFKEVCPQTPTPDRCDPINQATDLWNSGYDLLTAEKANEAIEKFKKAAALLEYAHAHSGLGLAFEKQGDLGRAVHEYREALKINPKHGNAHESLGSIFYNQGNFDQAIVEYRAAFETYPGSDNIQINLGNALLEIWHLNEAILAYQEALKLEPRNRIASKNLDIALRKQQELNEEIREQRKILKADPKNAETHNNLGVSLLRQGNISEAMKEYREALKINPQLFEPHHNLGEIFYKQGNFSEAVVKFKEALKIRPNSAESHNMLGYTFSKLGSLNEAIAEYREALKINPQLADAHNNLGELLYKQGNLNEAIQEYQEELKINPKHAEAQYNLYIALEENQKKLTERAITPSYPVPEISLNALGKNRNSRYSINPQEILKGLDGWSLYFKSNPNFYYYINFQPPKTSQDLKRPIYKKPVFWIALGGGVAAVTALGVGLGLSLRPQGNLPFPQDGHKGSPLIQSSAPDTTIRGFMSLQQGIDFYLGRPF